MSGTTLLSVELMRDTLIAWVSAWPRAIALLAMLPFFRRDTVPGLLKVGLVGALCMPLVPWLQAQIPTASLSAPYLLMVLAKEALIGFALGLPIALIFWAAEGAGAILDNQSGASVASTLNPASGNEVAMLSNLLHQVFMMAFLVAGGMTWLIGTLYQSYRIWPPFAWWPGFDMAAASWWLARLDHSLRTAVVLAGPIALGLFIVELGFGMIGRFAPRMQVFVLAMPVKSVLALLLLALYAGVLLMHFDTMAASLRETALTAMKVIR